MQTRAAIKKEHEDGDSINWDTESIFDPPQRNSKSHELDSKIGAKPTSIPSSNYPPFTPLGIDDSEKTQAVDTLSFKQSYSNDLEDDSFSDYLGINHPSLKGSPMAQSPVAPVANDLHLNIPFPSPLHDMNEKDAQIMNEALGMSFDFNENSAAMGVNSSPPGGRMGFDFPRLRPSNSSFSLSTPPRNTSASMDRPPEHQKDSSSTATFSVDTGNQFSSASNYGTPTRHFNQGRAVYLVASKSPSKFGPNSHSTPERSYQDKKEENSEKSPEFSPPRSKMRTEPRTHNGPIKSGSSNSHSLHRNDIIPVKSSTSDFCVTPSPSHSQSRISKAVSDESNTPPAMLHYPPSTMHPMSYHGSVSGTPASASFPSSGEAGLPHPPSYTSPNWSNSLHLAPLPPFVSSNGAPPTPQWHHANGAPPQANGPAPYGYSNYSPYYPQTTPPRYPSQSSSKESSAEATHWRQKHHLLYQFRAKFGHCRVPPGYGVGTEYEGLFEWVMDQHYQHQRMMNREATNMTPTRARVLSDIGVVFAQAPNDRPKVVTSSSVPAERRAPSSWSNWMSQLAEYRKRHGDCDVPLKYPANPSLGVFVNRQRTEYRKMLAKKPSSMTNEKMEELNKLGFTWAVRESHTSWEERFEELKAFKRENGHVNVPKIYSKNPSLGYWVNEQRFQYRRMQKKKSSYMTEDKIKALNSLDFKWSLRETNGSWDNWLKELKAYKDQHGDVDVPLKYKPNLALGAFVNRQRTEYRKLSQGLQTSLTNKRINDLNSLGFKWAIRVSRTPWEQRLDELKQFKAEHGHTNVPSTYPPNQPLAYWIFKQRGQYRIYMKNFASETNGDDATVCHMTPERIRMLDEIGFEWNPPRRMK